MTTEIETHAVCTDADLVALFKALGHPQRLAILRLLGENELCVCQIEEALDLRQAYVSQLLTQLREMGLVCFRKEGWKVWYRLARTEVHTLLQLAADIHNSLGECAWTPPEVDASTVDASTVDASTFDAAEGCRAVADTSSGCMCARPQAAQRP